MAGKFEIMTDGAVTICLVVSPKAEEVAPVAAADEAASSEPELIRKAKATDEDEDAKRTRPCGPSLGSAIRAPNTMAPGTTRGLRWPTISRPAGASVPFAGTNKLVRFEGRFAVGRLSC